MSTSFFNSKILKNMVMSLFKKGVILEVNFLYVLIICPCLKTVKTFGNPSLVSNAPGMKVTQCRTQLR